MNNSAKLQIEEILIRLANEEFTSADEWIDLWDENHESFQEVLPRTWYLKIKPKLSQSSVRILSYSSQNAKLYLDSLGLEYKNRLGGSSYSDKWHSQLEQENHSQDYSSLDIMVNDYPALVNFIIKNKKDYSLTINDNHIVIEKTKCLLPVEVINFFKKIESFSIEGFVLERSAIYSDMSLNRIKVGEFWLYNDGDELFIKQNDDGIYLLIMHTQEEEKLANSFYDLLNNVLVEYLKEDE